MNRFYPHAALVGAVFFCLTGSPASAQGIYKWTDANGTVHYGDQAGAPQSSTKIHVPAAAPRASPASPAAAGGAQRRAPSTPLRNMEKKSVPVAPTAVGPQCKGLVDKIAAVPAGTNWEHLYRQYESACPGIAYECVQYQSSPQNNQCTWVQRVGTSVLNTKQYP